MDTGDGKEKKREILFLVCQGRKRMDDKKQVSNVCNGLRVILTYKQLVKEGREREDEVASSTSSIWMIISFLLFCQQISCVIVKARNQSDSMLQIKASNLKDDQHSKPRNVKTGESFEFDVTSKEWRFIIDSSLLQCSATLEPLGIFDIEGSICLHSFFSFLQFIMPKYNQLRFSKFLLSLFWTNCWKPSKAQRQDFSGKYILHPVLRKRAILNLYTANCTISQNQHLLNCILFEVRKLLGYTKLLQINSIARRLSLLNSYAQCYFILCFHTNNLYFISNFLN